MYGLYCFTLWARDAWKEKRRQREAERNDEERVRIIPDERTWEGMVSVNVLGTKGVLTSLPLYVPVAGSEVSEHHTAS